MTALTRQMTKIPEKTREEMVRSRVAISGVSKPALCALAIWPAAELSTASIPFLGWTGTLMIVLFSLMVILTLIQWAITGAESSDERKNEQEVKAQRKMRELGLKGRPYPVYFWDAVKEPRDRHRSHLGSRICVRVHKVTRTESYSSFIPGYQIKPARGETVAEVVDSEEGKEFSLKSTTIADQYLADERDPSRDPEMDGVLSEEDEQTLTRVQAWVNSLNAQAKSEYESGLKGQLALPPAPEPVDHKLHQVRQIQRRAHAKR